MIEYRTSSIPVETRAGKSSSGSLICGYAAVFNSMSNDLGDGKREMREVIRPGAFAPLLARGCDVRALIDHDATKIIGRTSNGSLRLKEDSRGLFFELEPIDTTLGTDTLKAVRAGLLTGCSFAFKVAPGGDSWRSEGGCYVREIRAMSDLMDISIVTYPAYPATVCYTDRRSPPPDLQPFFDRVRMLEISLPPPRNY